MIKFVFSLGVALSFLTVPVANAQVQLFVAVDGNDSNIGSKDSPLATLQGARNRIRELRKAGPDLSAMVIVQEGVYEFAEPLAFEEIDSGRPEQRVRYQAAEGQQVILRGGRSVTEFLHCKNETDVPAFPNKQKVWRVDLRPFSLGSFGVRPERHVHDTMHPAHFGLVVDGQPQRFARWPNAGWYKLNDADLKDNLLSIPIDKLDISKSLDSHSAWAHGFWNCDWEDSFHPVELTVRNKRIFLNFTDASQIEPNVGARFRIENLPSQLDLTGEWYVDADSHQAYIYSEDKPTEAYLATVDCPVTFYGVSNLDFSGFIIEGARNCGIEIAGGSQLNVDHCIVRNVGNTGIHVYHGENHVVSHCQIYNCGAGGVRVEAGDRLTLNSCGHSIENNHIYDFSFDYLSYRPAVNVVGVGTTVRDNRIHHGPHAGILLYGNDHKVENNDISHVCLETDDVGAIYIGGNPTFRGNQIVDNFIHDCGSEGRTGVIGIYLDDFTSGTLVKGNAIQRLPRGIVVGGGRDNLLENNVVLQCLAAIQLDGRGATWANEFLAGTESQYKLLCEEVQHTESVYSTRYPELAGVLNDSPELPKGNVVARNWIDSPIAVDLQRGANHQLVKTDRNVVQALRYLVDKGEGKFEFNPAGVKLLSELKTGEAIDGGRLIYRLEK